MTCKFQSILFLTDSQSALSILSSALSYLLPESLWNVWSLASSLSNNTTLCVKKFCEDLFFLESTCACVLGPWPRPRAFLSLASRVSAFGKTVLGPVFCVLGLGLEPCVLDSTSAGKVAPLPLFGKKRAALLLVVT